MEKCFLSKSEEQTLLFARAIAEQLQDGDNLALIGELGSGKTHFVKGLALGLGVEETVTSPTFTLINEYSGKKRMLYHFDFYRLGDSYEVEDLGIEDYFDSDGIVVVEWADKFLEIFPENTLILRFENRGMEERAIILQSEGRDGLSWD